MDTNTLAASAVAGAAKGARDGFAIAALKIANEQDQLVAGIVAQAAETAKAMTEAGVGGNVDRMA